jgi:ribonuclease HI
VHIFTDGSYDSVTNRTGYGIHCIFFEEATPMGAGETYFDAEVAAIARAAEKIAETPAFPLNKTKFVILSDSVSAIQFITQAANLHPKSLLFKNSLASLRQQNKLLEAQWIPSHCKIMGNEKADFLAKSATKAPQPPAAPLSFKNVKTKIKSITQKIFMNTTEETSRLKNWWTEIKKGPDKDWSRKTATAHFRLATGHDVLQHHLHRFNITNEPATCKLCNLEDQDRAHLFRCAALKSDIDSLPDELSRIEKEAVLYWIARQKNG